MRRHGGGRSPHGGRGQSPRGGARSSGRAGGQIGREAPILGDVFAPLWGAFDSLLGPKPARKSARRGQPTRPQSLRSVGTALRVRGFPTAPRH
jgi:hypothetical protein